MSRRVRITIAPNTTTLEAVPLATLARTLGAFQRAVLQIAEMLAGSQPARSRGGFKLALRDACQFTVVGLSVGSTVAEVVLPETSQSVFPEMDLGIQSTDRLLDLSELLTANPDWDRVVRLLPAPGYRRQILRTYQDVCPTEDEALSVTLQDGDKPARAYRLGLEQRTLARVYAAKVAREDTVERRAFIGRLFEVSKKHGLQFGLKQRGREFEFPADIEQQDDILDFLRRDSWVRVDAVCRVLKSDDRDDEVIELLDVDQLTEVDMSELRITEIELEGRALALLEPITADAQAEGGLVVLEYAPLGITVAGGARPEAEKAFREELAWLWAAYADSPDSELTEDARKLKARLRALTGGEA
jgi:hypothetical protein